MVAFLFLFSCLIHRALAKPIWREGERASFSTCFLARFYQWRGDGHAPLYPTQCSVHGKGSRQSTPRCGTMVTWFAEVFTSQSLTLKPEFSFGSSV